MTTFKSLAALIFLVFCLVPGASAGETTMRVQVRKAKLKAEPAPFSKVTETVKLAQEVTVIEEKGIWARIETGTPGITGWIPSASLTRRKLELEEAENVRTTATSGEMALAAKGFNPKVEKAFKKKNQDVSFEWVDRMEKVSFSYKQKMEFLEQGKVAGKGGAR
jgi:uncharacterized protein YgiM (DUF1202 family)